MDVACHHALDCWRLFSGKSLDLDLIKEPHLRAWAFFAVRAIAPGGLVQLFLQALGMTRQAFDRGIALTDRLVALDDHGLQGLDIVR